MGPIARKVKPALNATVRRPIRSRMISASNARTIAGTSQTNVPFVDLQAQYKLVQEEVETSVIDALARADYVGGKAVSEFEQAFASYCGTRHAIGVGNGTDALQIALLALGAGPGKEVITVAHTFVATVEAIVNTGATPRFVDVDPITGTIDASQIQARVNGDTVAVVAVHLYGRPADMDEVLRVCDLFGVPVIEDAAQAQGAFYKGRRVGSLAAAACFSFYPSKNLGAAGDAGAITTESSELAARMRLIANHGSRTRYVHELRGYNTRLDTLQAVVLSAKLRHLDSWNERRSEAARRYHDHLKNVEGVLLPAADSNAVKGVHHLFAVRLENRDAIGLELKHRGIATAVHYPVGVHRQAPYRAFAEDPLPVTEHWADSELSLPMFETIADEQIERVCSNLKDVLRTR